MHSDAHCLWSLLTYTLFSQPRPQHQCIVIQLRAYAACRCMSTVHLVPVNKTGSTTTSRCWLVEALAWLRTLPSSRTSPSWRPLRTLSEWNVTRWVSVDQLSSRFCHLLVNMWKFRWDDRHRIQENECTRSGQINTSIKFVMLMLTCRCNKTKPASTNFQAMHA